MYASAANPIPSGKEVLPMMRPRTLRRLAVAATASAWLALSGAGPASADPGVNFPEQPGDRLAQGCLSIATNPDRALNFVTGEQHMSNTAAAILIAQYADACLE
jgi:hypothetical protein